MQPMDLIAYLKDQYLQYIYDVYLSIVSSIRDFSQIFPHWSKSHELRKLYITCSLDATAAKT